MRSVFVFGVFCFFCPRAFASPETTGGTVWELPAIVRVQSPAESWDEKGGLNSEVVSSEAFQGGGTVGTALERVVGTPVLSTGRAGGLVQARGLGGGSEEVGVRALGIPLNPAQGGGFDLSTFPSWYWSSFRFRPGATQAGGENRAVGAAIDLTPWTAAALDDASAITGRVHVLGDTLGWAETAVAARGEAWAAQAGYSSGLIQGPTAGVSLQVLARGRAKTRLHLLATDRLSPAELDQTGSQHTRRVIPVLQHQARLDGGSELQLSAFYDWGDTVYASPSLGAELRSQTAQAGAQAALLNRRLGWKALLAARHAAFVTEGQQPPEETTLVAQVARFRPTDEQAGFEPSLGASWLSTWGALPQAALVYKLPESRERKWEFGLEYAQKAPTLVDRFFHWGAFFQGNPSLRPEHSLRARLGVGLTTSDERGHFTFEGYGEERFDSQILAGTEVVNLGEGRILGAQSRGEWQLIPTLGFRALVRATASRVLALEHEYPFMPALASRWSGEWTPWGKKGASLELGYETSEPVQVLGSAPTRLAGWGAFDLVVGIPLWKGSRLEAGIQNLADLPYEKLQGYPIRRSATVAWNSSF